MKVKERKQDTNAKKILDWLNSKPKGYIFKISELKKDLNLDNKQFDKIKKRNISIFELLKEMKTEIKGYYKII